MKPNAYQIAAFTMTARERSFSRAAALLGVTQSSVSQHVAKLEQIMGTHLFIRRREGLELTPAGRELFDVSDRLRNLEQRVSELVVNYGALDAGHLRIIATAPRPAMPIIARYAERYPQVEIDFSLASWTEAMRRVQEREVDIGLITEPTLSAGLHGQRIGAAGYLAYMRVNHPLARRPRLSLRRIAEESVILPEEGSLTQRIVRSKMKALGLSFARVIRTWTFPVVKEAILHGAGIGILLKNSLFPSSNLIEIPIEEMPETYQNYIVTPTDKRELRLVRSFFDVARYDASDLDKDC